MPWSLPGGIDGEASREDPAIRQVLMTIGRHAPVGITWPADLYGRVTLQLDAVPWRAALDQALAAVGWTWRKP